MTIIKPTVDDWRNEIIESVLREDDPSWRHGNYVYEVFFRDVDNTYWAINYQVSGDGEYHSLRDGEDTDFEQVFKHVNIIPVTTYKTNPQA